MTLHLSSRMARIKASPNAAAKQRANALRAAGHDILDLTIGEPDFATPEPIRQAACAAIAGGALHYPPAAGLRKTREAVVGKLQRENHLPYAVEQIFMGNGAKQVIFNAFAATLDQGDEVLIPAPYYPSFPDIVALHGGLPIALPCPWQQGFKLDAEQLAEAIGPRTRWLVLNAPGNPSGALYSDAEWLALADVLRKHPQVWILLDELYEHIRFDGQAPRNLLNLAPDLAARSLLVGGVSKTYAMTGWRIGFGAAPAALVSAMATLQSQSTSGANVIGQLAAQAAFEGGLDFLPAQLAIYRQRRDSLYQALSAVDGLQVLRPEGGFFLFIGCAGLIGKRTPEGLELVDDAAVVEYLLEQGVAAVNGASFGLSPYFRLSIATASEHVQAAGQRIAQAVSRLG